MADMLVEAFKNIGGHAPTRKINLRELVFRLSHDEARFCKNELATIDFRMDFIPILPVELLILVASHLNPDDVPKVLAVSPRWRASFSRDEVAHVLVQVIAPECVDYYQLQNRVLEEANNWAQVLRREVVRYLFRQRGRFRSGYSVPNFDTLPQDSRESFSLDPHFHPHDSTLTQQLRDVIVRHAEPPYLSSKGDLDRQYSNGRLVWNPYWWPGGGHIVVDDLRTRLRRVYTGPDNDVLRDEFMHLVHLGDTILIAVVKRKLLVLCPLSLSPLIYPD
jgi:hypothetical protein